MVSSVWVGSVRRPTPSSPEPPPSPGLLFSSKNKGKCCPFFWPGFWAPGPQTPKTIRALHFLGGVGGFLGNRGTSKTMGRSALLPTGEKCNGCSTPTRAVHARPKPSKTRVGAIALPGRGLAKTPGQANHRENGPFAPPSETLSPLILCPRGSFTVLRGRRHAFWGPSKAAGPPTNDDLSLDQGLGGHGAP